MTELYIFGKCIIRIGDTVSDLPIFQLFPNFGDAPEDIETIKTERDFYIEKYLKPDSEAHLKNRSLLNKVLYEQQHEFQIKTV